MQRDIDIWNAFRSGDKDAFATIYALYFDALYSYGKRFIADETRVEDAIQDLFINLWRSHANVSPVDNIKFYLFRSLRRDIYRITEKEKNFPKVELDAFLHEYDLPGEEHSIHDEEKELTQKLAAVLQNLPKRQLEAITLRYYENFSISEIAEIMDVSDKTVRNTLHNSLTLLRKNSRLFYTVFELALAFIWH
ncbi:RNA polymerase sigma factor [Dyadobacter fermentans]|uniref:RNA polymerase, sigma-24 subunit, ECF subfamily n=1 Tax=Dyadobacter fermentans (strain ATCC 700827 / DSM 18053 / CIP 107007 / KCTC 52180 / NS114) TaxID=471854 RepID=C6VZP7_DYAFD|nr:sigma-70 family RNA polymerase sigma factor [Dyadobacter fermentans]ACT93525.1 RNA polymerase, sigma-24 subunit, ECF subfamily [Dyadobacter fermentans DSM 18053]